MTQHEGGGLNVRRHVNMSAELDERIRADARRLELTVSGWLRQAALEKLARTEQRETDLNR